MKYFVQPEFIYGIPVILALLLIIYWRSLLKADQKLNQMVAKKLRPKLIPGYSKGKQILKFSLFALGLTFLMLAWIGPQWGNTKQVITPRGIDILIAVDVSKSMLARDVRPNRLERVKLSLSNALSKVKGDRLGLIAFSGSSFLQCPLTLDHQAFDKSLEALDVGLIPRMGTNLALPIEEAIRSFSPDDTDKFLVLISDGEDLEGQGLQMAKQAAKKGVRIYTVGIGSQQGAFIPTDKVDQKAQNFLTDRQGKKVVSKLDDSALSDIALSTAGQYLPIGPTGEGISHIFSELQAFGQKKLHEQLSTELPINRYQIFILLGLVFLISETFTSSAKINFSTQSIQSIVILFLFLTGCWKSENIKLAEEALATGNPGKAAEFYTQEIDRIEPVNEDDLCILHLNAGLALGDAGQTNNAEKHLRLALETASNLPEIQSKALNGLGNIYYQKANAMLDRQDVNQARKAWEKAKGFYTDAFSINGNFLAEENLNSLNNQIQERIESLLCKIEGMVWRDLNGNGQVDKREPGLESIVFWDRDDDGELNKTKEPYIFTNNQGHFAFEWISGNFPTNLSLSSILKEQNQTKESNLIPLFPLPPPPIQAKSVRNHYISLEKPGLHNVTIPWRKAPVLKGRVWNDSNGNGKLDSNESGSAAATIFIDSNGNFQIDEDETSFKPKEDGSFSQVIDPGQYSISIIADNKEANITCPIDDHKAYLTWLDFEQNPQPLMFGLQDDGNNSSSLEKQNNQSNQHEEPEPSEQNSNQENMEAQSQEEMNALYERLLQETESQSEPLELEPVFSVPANPGRDY